MSKIKPVAEPKYYASRCRHGDAEVCPRLEKWMEKANSGGFVDKRKASKASVKSRKYLGMFTSTKRKRTPGSVRRLPGSPRGKLSSKRFRESQKTNGSQRRKSPRKPIRAKTIFNNIRQKSRNFGIRCQTSVSLWKQWIVKGIRWDRHNPLSSLARIKNSSKSSVTDIDNIKPRRSKKQLPDTRSVISYTIEEADEERVKSPEEKKSAPEVPKMKQFLGMSYFSKATNIFRKHSKDLKVATPTELSSVEEVHENEEHTGGRTTPEIEDYEEVDDISLSDRELRTPSDVKDRKSSGGSSAKSAATTKLPMKKLAEIDTEKIEKIGNQVKKREEDDEFYDDDIYYDHHLNGYYRTESDPVEDDLARKQANEKSKGAIHRAFNKLKLFF